MWPITLEECAKSLQISLPQGAISQTSLESAFTDSRKLKKSGLFVAIKGEKFDGHAYVKQVLEAGAAAAIVEQKWFDACELNAELKARCLVVKDTLTGFRKLAANFRSQMKHPVFGIGGSNGKTTTKEILASLLLGRGKGEVVKTEKSENGFLGIAITLTNEKFRKGNAIDALVLEIGIDNSGAMAEHVTLSHPDCSLLTALGPEHIEGLGTWENAIREEMKLFDLGHEPTKRIWNFAETEIYRFIKNARENDTFVFSNDQLHLACEHSESSSLKDLIRKNFNLMMYQISSSDLFGQEISWTWYSEGKEVNKNKIKIPLAGHHNATNFCMAAAAALTMGWTADEILNGFKNFVPPPQRSDIKKLKNETILIDDSYNASPLSTKAALEHLFNAPLKDMEKIVVLGDMLELGEESKKWHLDLVPLLGKIKKTTICLYGDEMRFVYDELLKTKHKLDDNNSSVTYLSKQEDPRQFMNGVSQSKAIALLIKGSRGMGLERVVQHYLHMAQEGGM